MCWHFPNPRNSAVLHFHIRVQALGDGLVDNGGLPLLIVLDAGLVLGDDLVNLGTLSVQIGGNGGLLGKRGKHYLDIFHVVRRNSF